MHGMNLGNWLLLEKWMSNTWFNEACGNESATDQWSFLQSIDDEDKAKEVLQNHYGTWVCINPVLGFSS